MIISRKDEIIKIRSQEASLIIEPSQLKIEDFIIKGPGEYEVKGISLEAIAWDIYVITLEDMRLAYLKTDKLSNRQLEALNGVDILLVNNQNLINQIQPRLVIFIKDISDKILIKKRDLPHEGSEIWKPSAKK